MRRFSETDYLSLKRVLDVAYELAGGVSVLRHVTRVSISQLSKYTSAVKSALDDPRSDEKTFIPVDVAIDVDRAAKEPLITAKMAELLGYRLVAAEERVANAGALSVEDAFRVIDEATDFWRLVREAFADGRIDALEKQQLRFKIGELIRAAHVISEKLED